MIAQTLYPNIESVDETKSNSERASAEPNNGDGDGDDEEYEPKRCYVAIDGIHPNDLEEQDKELLEKQIVTTLLTNGYPIEDVRVADKNNAIVDIQMEQ